PSTTTNLILSCLSPRDIIAFSLSCKQNYEETLSYNRVAYSIDDLLSPRYFTIEETQCFRTVQALTGAVISGSTALQLFSRVRWTESDLDLYVEHYTGYLMAMFLNNIGYNFQPTERQKIDLADAYDQAEIDEIYDDGRGFASVFNFQRGTSKIQLVTATHSSIDIILNFHSTVVMNVITAYDAFCFYPLATFEKRISLMTFSDIGPDRERARVKYLERGWVLINAGGSIWKPNSLSYYSTLDCISLAPFHLSTPRHVGDHFSWTIRLP
ncbi:hypothetical protein K435DRAFT_596403, partial [Dendrothele bispora CBS 962.96]